MLLLISGEEEDNRIRVYVLEGILIMVPDEGLEAQIQEETGLCHKLFRVGVQSPRSLTSNPMLMLTRKLQCNMRRRLAE